MAEITNIRPSFGKESRGTQAWASGKPAKPAERAGERHPAGMRPAAAGGASTCAAGCRAGRARARRGSWAPRAAETCGGRVRALEEGEGERKGAGRGPLPLGARRAVPPAPPPTAPRAAGEGGGGGWAPRWQLGGAEGLRDRRARGLVSGEPGLRGSARGAAARPAGRGARGWRPPRALERGSAP